MGFLEYETWRLKKDCPMDAYENMIETWFRYVVEKKKDRKSTRLNSSHS